MLNAAYNDAAGVTAEFNLNLLMRINRELGGTFNLDTFEHHAFYNRERNRVEMHLASLKRQKVKVAGEMFRIPRRRNHPYREQLQILGRVAGRAGARRRLAAGRGVDRREEVFLDPGLHAGPSRRQSRNGSRRLIPGASAKTCALMRRLSTAKFAGRPF